MFLWHINKPKKSLNISFFYVALRIKTSLRKIENEKYLIKWRNRKLKYSKRRDSNWLSIGVFWCWKWQIKPGFMAKWHVRGDICNQKKQLKRRENVFATQHYFLRKKTVLQFEFVFLSRWLTDKPCPSWILPVLYWKMVYFGDNVDWDICSCRCSDWVLYVLQPIALSHTTCV